MTLVLRVYDPIECDERGVPRDWERCRECDGRRTVVAGIWDSGSDHGTLDEAGGVVRHPCPTCGGHGSLKAAALAALRLHDPDCPATNQHGGVCVCDKTQWAAEDRSNRTELVTARCEGCGHPMSEGTWEGERGTWTFAKVLASLVDAARRGVDVQAMAFNASAIHYSRCDEGCRHTAHGVRNEHGPCTPDAGNWPSNGPMGWFVKAFPEVTYEASWRLVDVRTLGWPHDLRPEKLAVLCLRCLAARES